MIKLRRLFAASFVAYALALIVAAIVLLPASVALAGIIDEVLDNITGRFRSAVDFIFDPLWVWYFWLGVAILGGGFIMWLFGWIKAVRIGVSLAIAGAAIYVAGGRHMHNRLKGDIEAERARLRQREAEAKEARRQQGGGGLFGGWR